MGRVCYIVSGVSTIEEVGMTRFDMSELVEASELEPIEVRKLKKRFDFLDLKEVEDKWCLFAKIGNQHGHFLLFPVTFADSPHKFDEWTLNNTHTLTFGEIELRLLRLLHSRRICCHRLLLFSDL